VEKKQKKATEDSCSRWFLQTHRLS